MLTVLIDIALCVKHTQQRVLSLEAPREVEVIYNSLSISENRGGGCVGRVIICGPSELLY